MKHTTSALRGLLLLSNTTSRTSGPRKHGSRYRIWALQAVLMYRKKLYTIATSVWDWVFSIQVIISVSSDVKIKAQGDLQGSKVKVKKGSFQYKTKR
jgi:hypothetical protein